MAQSTVYDVKLVYSLQDRGAVAGTNSLAEATKRADKSASGLLDTLLGIGATVVAGVGLGKLKHLFIDLNSEMEQMKISMASVMQYNLGGTFEQAAAHTDKLVASWQEFSKQTTLTTQQFVHFGSSLTGAVANAGGGLDMLDAIVKKGAVVGQILSAGHAGGLQYVSLELREALMGNVRKMQMFNQQLLGPVMKKMGKEMEDFNKLSAAKRLEVIMAALNDPAWNGAIGKMKGSFLGVTSTFKDLMEIMGREVGEPVFKAITTEISGWNDWLKKNEVTVREIADKIKTGLVDGFRDVKAVVVYIADHYSEIKLLVEALLLLKGVGMIGNGVAGGIGALSKTLGVLNAGFVGGAAGLTGMATAVGSTVAALGLFALGLQALADLIDQFHAKRVVQEGDRGALLDRMQTARTAAEAFSYTKAYARQFGALSEAGLDTHKMQNGLNGMGYSAVEQAKLIDLFTKAWWAVSDDARRGSAPARAREEKPYAPEVKKADKQHINVTIQRVEVASSDPDRFVMDLVDVADRALERPTQARTSWRSG